MRILILGGTGMLGHALGRAVPSGHEVFVTLRSPVPPDHPAIRFDPSHCVCGFDASNSSLLETTIERIAPDAVINCSGVVKQSRDLSDRNLTVRINALLPHELARICGARRIRLIHVSTDCVFDGRKGNYRETDTPCPPDFYGASKLLGEIPDTDALTIRTSIIGHELFTSNGLLAWLLGRRTGEQIQGYANAVFTGFTTAELSRIILSVLECHPGLKGLRHVSSGRISKYDLLRRIIRTFQLNLDLRRETRFRCDRSLDSSLFRKETGYKPPSWDEMIGELVKEKTFYRA